MTSASDHSSGTGPGHLSEALLLHAPDLILELSSRGIEYISPNVREILGRDPMALLGQPFEILAHQDDRLGLANAVRAAATGPGRISVRRRLLHADGRALWFEVAVTAFMPTDGGPRSAVMVRQVAHWISDERELESLRGILDTLPESVIPNPTLVIDSDRHVFATNVAWRSQQPEGTPPVEGRFYAEVVAGRVDDVTARRLVALVDQAFEGASPGPAVIRWMTESGAQWWQVQAGFSRHGGFVTLSHENVTALVEAEQGLLRQRQVLEHSQKLARIGHWEFSTDGSIFRPSPELLEIFGVPVGGIATVTALTRLVPERELDLIRAAINAARKGQPDAPVRHRIVRPDGTVRWVDHSFDLRPGPSGDMPILIGVMKDVTEEVIALDAMRQSADAIRQSSEAIRESDERQRQALRIARASIWKWDRATRTIWNSSALFEMLGYESSEGASEPTKALRHPDDLERATRTAEDAIRRREPYVFRSRLAHADGRWVWMEERGQPLFDGAGELIGYRGTTQDVDEQVRREEALRESDDRQRQALHVARAIIWTWDRRTRTVWRSPGLHQMFGFDGLPDDPEERLAFLHPDDREHYRETYEDSIRRRQPFTVRYRLALPDGRWVWIEDRGAPVFEATGELIGYRGTAQDVDERIRYEEALRESDDRQREALSIARAAIWRWDHATGKVEQSPELYRLLGYDTPFTTYGDIAALRHPDDRDRTVRETREAVEARRPYTIRYRLRRTDGVYIWVEARGVPVIDASGELTGYRGTSQDIDEQVRREEELRRSEALLDEAQRLTKVGAWSINLDTDIDQWSEGMYSILGYAPGEVAPAREAIFARVHPDGQADVVRRITKRLDKLREEGGRDTGSLRIMLPDGTVRHLNVSTERLDDNQGRPLELLGVAQDVTEQREAEARVRRSEERLRAVLDSAGDGITLLSIDGRNNWANEAFHRMVGYPLEELHAMGSAQLATTLLDPEAAQDIEQWFRTAREQGPENVVLPSSYPMRLHRKDGTFISTESTLSMLREDGEAVGLLSVIRDTTERDALRRQLEAATLEINQILQTAALPIIVIDEDGAIRMANQRTADVFGWTPEELIGQDVSILSGGLNPTSHRERIRHYQETGTASSPRGPMLGRTLEVVARHRDGHEFPVEVAVTEMTDPSGRHGYLGVVTDLTERIRAQEELLRMQKSEALGTLVAGVAHDFNNLLTAMVGGIELAKAQPGEPRWLDVAHEAADRAIRLVQQLLQFSRRSHTALQQVDPAGLVERTTALVRETFDRRIKVGLELQTVRDVIPGDEGQLQQVVMNLLLNARDAVLERAERGEPNFKPTITVAMREDRLPAGRAVRIDVRDNGTGMTPEVRARAFDPFFTTKPVDRGTGLGLATVAGIIERHKGEVTVDSAVDRGTTISIRLPLVDASPNETASAGQSDAAALSATRTVMVIDDEEMVRTITAGYLEANGFRVISTDNGSEAIRLLETTSDVDLVVTDLNMPSPNGWEIIARLRGQPGIPPIVVASGYADEAAALERGAAGFLHKPFSQDDLVRTVERLLDRE